FPVIPFFTAPYDSQALHTKGPGEWGLTAKIVEPAQIRNHRYRVAIVDSIDVQRNKGFTLINLTRGDTLLRNNPLPDVLSHNVPVTEGFKIFRGADFAEEGVSNDSTQWVSSFPQWITGSGLFGGWKSGFIGGVIPGTISTNFFGAYGPSLSKLVPVEIRFDSTKPQKAYRLLRDFNRTGNSYVVGRGFALHQTILSGTISGIGARADTIRGTGTSFLSDFAANEATGLSGALSPGTKIRLDESVDGSGAFRDFTVARVFNNNLLVLSVVPQRVFTPQSVRRIGDQPYAPLDTLPFVDVPFSAWDMRNPSAPRQLDVSFRDPFRDGTWTPGVATDYFNIYGSTYDPTGLKFGSYNPGAANDSAQSPNIATVGSKADIVYVADLAIMPGHVMSESPGTINVQPWYGLTKYDQFEFELRYDANLVPPSTFEFFQNYPNPFNPSTKIKFEVPEFSDVSIKLYNILGQEVATVFEGQKDTGRYIVDWNGRDASGTQVATGVYFCRMRVGGFAKTLKMLLIR
ncbi:MAG: hypothetical protein HW407_2008, partial [Bacteroidetes bacterium]|nr:hypothetical protein [Bacteroidota bacterium]